MFIAISLAVLGSYLDGASTPMSFWSGHLAQESQIYPNGFADPRTSLLNFKRQVLVTGLGRK